MSQEEIQQLVITPTEDQLFRFIIWHTHTYGSGSSFRHEQFADQLAVMRMELHNTGKITLVDKYMIEDWNYLVENNFILGEKVYKPDNDYGNTLSSHALGQNA